MNALMPTYARADLQIVRGDGAYLYDVNGRDYLDLASGIAVNALGHGDPGLVQALADQAARLWHVSNLYRIPQQEALAEALCAHTFADHVFFANSGAEAVEAAIKTAKRWHYVEGRPERYRFITFKNAFHGRTIATSRRPIRRRSEAVSNPCSTGSITSPSTTWQGSRPPSDHTRQASWSNRSRARAA